MLSLHAPQSHIPHHIQTSLPHDMAISESDVQIDMGSLTCPDSVTDFYHGTYRGQPARFKGKRHLSCYSKVGIVVQSLLVHEVLIRRQHQSARHVPQIGIYQTSASLGARTFLVEAPYHYVDLYDYLVENPEADRLAMLKGTLEILADLHSAGFVLGLITLKSFVVDSSGALHLSSFDNVRFEASSIPFRPIPSLTLKMMAHAAPELLQSFRDDGDVSPTKASDMYSFGCFAYELLTGNSPLPPMYMGFPPFMALAQFITAVVDCEERPDRPGEESNAHAHEYAGLTDQTWVTIKECWDPVPASRPTALLLLARHG